MYLQVKKLHEDAILPTKAYEGDAGWDLYALEDFVISSLLPLKIRTGIAVKLPEGTFGQIANRSSMSAKGIVVSGGIIDNGYTGELVVILNSIKPAVDNQELFTYNTLSFKKGDKIAQLLILPLLNPKLIKVTDLHNTERSDRGFGSSGK